MQRKQSIIKLFYENNMPVTIYKYNLTRVQKNRTTKAAIAVQPPMVGCVRSTPMTSVRRICLD